MGIENCRNNQLFLICPFCQMEHFIRKHYGEALFLTAPAAIFHFGVEEVQAIRDFIARENITRIFLVAETSCNFTHNVLYNKNHSGLRCETDIQKLKSAEDTLCSLTHKIATQEAARLEKIFLNGIAVNSAAIQLHALLTYKNQNRIIKIK